MVQFLEKVIKKKCLVVLDHIIFKKFFLKNFDKENILIIKQFLLKWYFNYPWQVNWTHTKIILSEACKGLFHIILIFISCDINLNISLRVWYEILKIIIKKPEKYVYE